MVYFVFCSFVVMVFSSVLGESFSFFILFVLGMVLLIRFLLKEVFGY